ncbi:MAG TPA: UDP-N-acetyl-D-mannosamine dehydrogenase [Propionicimonas sp.]|jgi:UDP-N-acetyl-D-mannosaminuronic acid dehydrogenase|nr:UDP-N-acetyl-D-mannosamine dehydrogenase [Propionicimonas sp.]
MNNPRVCVVGLGYIGLPTAVALCQGGLDVVGLEVNERIVAEVTKGILPFVEPGLAEALSEAHRSGRLSATTKAEPADTFILAVPTPFQDDHEPDLSYIRSAVEAITPVLVADNTVILESTSPPGTTALVKTWIEELRPDLITDGQLGISLAYCPERVLPGRIMTELITNDRVIGGINPDDAERAAAVYRVFCQGELLLTDATTAEMVKLVENSFRDVNIAFANELSLIAETVGVDVWELIRLANHHPRVNILQPGPGVGGHCIAVDPWFIVSADPANSPLIRTAREVNDGKPDRVIDQVIQAIEGVEAPVVAALGISFKPDIDDLRESPARAIVGRLAAQLPHAEVRVVEPHINALPAELDALSNVELVSIEQAIPGADCVVLLVDHAQFKATRPTIPPRTTVIDTRGAWRS